MFPSTRRLLLQLEPSKIEHRRHLRKYAEVENEDSDDADASRKQVRQWIEAVYDMPANTSSSTQPPK